MKAESFLDILMWKYYMKPKWQTATGYGTLNIKKEAFNCLWSSLNLYNFFMVECWGWIEERIEAAL